jgi:hypothetical protein
MAARCEKLLSVDVVTRPAANDGLFSVPSVDKNENNMAKEKTEGNPGVDPNAQPEPTMSDIMEVLQHLNGRLDQHEQFLGQLQEAGQGQEEDVGPTLEQLSQASDEELAQLGITRAEVDAAVQEVLAGMEAEGQGQPDGTVPQGEGQGEPAMAGAAPGGFGAAGSGTAGGPTSGAANFKALSDKVVRLESTLKLNELRKKKEAEDIELSEIEQKVLILADQRDQAIQFATNLKAENDALRLAVKTGTRPVTAGVDNGMRMFSANDNGELHEFSIRVKQLVESGKSQAEAIRFAQKENPAMHADWVESQRRKPVA